MVILELLMVFKKYGKLIIGLLTDRAASNHKRIPLLNYEQREIIIKNISNVHKVVEQNDWDDSINISSNEFVIHGDDWKTGPQSNLRLKLLKY